MDFCHGAREHKCLVCFPFGGRELNVVTLFQREGYSYTIYIYLVDVRCLIVIKS